MNSDGEEFGDWEDEREGVEFDGNYFTVNQGDSWDLTPENLERLWAEIAELEGQWWRLARTPQNDGGQKSDTDSRDALVDQNPETVTGDNRWLRWYLSGTVVETALRMGRNGLSFYQVVVQLENGFACMYVRRDELKVIAQNLVSGQLVHAAGVVRPRRVVSESKGPVWLDPVEHLSLADTGGSPKTSRLGDYLQMRSNIGTSNTDDRLPVGQLGKFMDRRKPRRMRFMSPEEAADGYLFGIFDLREKNYELYAINFDGEPFATLKSSGLTGPNRYDVVWHLELRPHPWAQEIADHIWDLGSRQLMPDTVEPGRAICVTGWECGMRIQFDLR
jgi:hypothetical protein